jgi:hypothetical protein
MENSLVKMRNFANSKDKFGYVFMLTPSGVVENTALMHLFLRRKLDEYEVLKLEIEALKADVGEDQDGGLRKHAQ